MANEVYVFDKTYPRVFLWLDEWFSLYHADKHIFANPYL